MKRLIYLSILIFTLSNVFGQSTIPTNTETPASILKIDLLNVLNPIDPSVLVSIEHFPSNQKISLIHEAGVVVDIRQYEQVDLVKSFKTRHELRYYFEGLFENTGIPVPYVSADIQYRYLVVNERYVLGYQCEEDCNYYRNFKGNIPTNMWTYQVRFGSQTSFGKRLVFDVNFGFGQRSYTVKRSAVYHGSFIDDERFISENKLGTRLVLSAQGKLGWTFPSK